MEFIWFIIQWKERQSRLLTCSECTLKIQSSEAQQSIIVPEESHVETSNSSALLTPSQLKLLNENEQVKNWMKSETLQNSIRQLVEEKTLRLEKLKNENVDQNKSLIDRYKLDHELVSKATSTDPELNQVVDILLKTVGARDASGHFVL